MPSAMISRVEDWVRMSFKTLICMKRGSMNMMTMTIRISASRMALFKRKFLTARPDTDTVCPSRPRRRSWTSP